MLVTDGYRQTLQAMHASGPWGIKGYKAHLPLMPFFAELQATTILDYGSGTETLRQNLPHIDVRCYDPGIPGREQLPEPADLVVCTDVLEHIEPKLLDNVLAHIASLAIKGVYLNIACGPARAILPDGRNAHLIVENGEWWLSRLRETKGWKVVQHEDVRKKIRVWLKVV